MSFDNWRLLALFACVVLPQLCLGAVFAYDVDRNNSLNEVVERPTGWLQAAQDMIASPAGHVVTQVAKELINRSTGNSQVGGKCCGAFKNVIMKKQKVPRTTRIFAKVLNKISKPDNIIFIVIYSFMKLSSKTNKFGVVKSKLCEVKDIFSRAMLEVLF